LKFGPDPSAGTAQTKSLTTRESEKNAATRGEWQQSMGANMAGL
jgi:hypothetical protein